VKTAPAQAPRHQESTVPNASSPFSPGRAVRNRFQQPLQLRPENKVEHEAGALSGFHYPTEALSARNWGRAATLPLRLHCAPGDRLSVPEYRRFPLVRDADRRDLPDIDSGRAME